MSFYLSRPNLIIGFHGCDISDQERLLQSDSYVKKSQNDYDWLGHGMYFWENNYMRAIQWAKMKMGSGFVKEPVAVGAVLDLGYCLDMFDSYAIRLLKQAYKLFDEESDQVITENKKHDKEQGEDKILRYRDCAVLEFAHKFFEKNEMKPFDSVRAAFVEGERIYPGAGFFEKTHIQICIRNPNCIKGFFMTRKESRKFSIV